MKNLVILISGRGSNMKAIIQAATNEKWPACITAVITNQPNAAGLKFASSQGIRTEVINHRLFEYRDLFDEMLSTKIDRFGADLIILAGFIRILTPAFIRRYEGRILNIHPSLLPSFKGINTHQKAIDSGVAIHGATVHFVNSELDSGAIIAQGAVPVKANDNANTLAERVLSLENKLYPLVVGWFVNNKLHFNGVHVSIPQNERRWIFLDE